MPDGERPELLWRTIAAVVLLVSPAFTPPVAAGRPVDALKRATLRVKVVSVEPEQPVLIAMQWGGRGLGGTVSNAVLQIREPDRPQLRAGADALKDDALEDDDLGLPPELQSDPAAMQTVRDKASGKTYLKPGFWSWPNPMAGLTVDEIGSVFNSSAEGKPHMSSCPDCQAAFRKWLEGMGMQPADFDCGSWSEVRNIAYPDARPWAETNAEEKRIAREKLEALPGVKPEATPLGLFESTTPFDLDEEPPAAAGRPGDSAGQPAARPTPR